MNARYAPTEPVPFDRQTPLVPPWHDEIPTRIDPFSRDDCALLLDYYLRRLVSLKNRVDPGLATGLARLRSGEKHRLLGFVRMKDYTEECLDLDWRRARYLMNIHEVFQGLPLLSRAFESGRLSWTKAREITPVADAETQGEWLDLACSTTVRLLARAVRRFKSTGRLPWEGDEISNGGCREKDIPDGADGNESGNASASLQAACNEEQGKSRLETGGDSSMSLNVIVEENMMANDISSARTDDDRGDSPWPTFSCPVPLSLRRRWEEAVESCRRQAGAETPLWECAEYMAAEILDTVSGLEGGGESSVDDQSISNSSGLTGAESSVDDQSMPDSRGLTGDDRIDFGPGDPAVGNHGQPGGDNHADRTEDPGDSSRLPSELSDENRDLIKAGIEQETDKWSFLSWAPMAVKLVGQLEADLELVKSAVAEASGRDGARRLHEALLRLVGYHELIERYLGRLLRFFGDHRLHERCLFLSLRHYAGERLGVSARQVGYLTSRERVFIHHPELEEAFLDGRVGSAKVRLLEPLARQVWPCDWKAWIERAEKVTVRRLTDEASWAIDYCQRDPVGWKDKKGKPPQTGEGPYALVDGRWHTCSGNDLDSLDASAGVAAIEGLNVVCPAPGVPGGNQGPGAGESNPPLTSLIRFTAPPEPASIWFRAMEACQRLIGNDAPTWRCLEMIVDHFLLVWAPERDPEHVTTGYPNAVFQRDGWRCTVPGCRLRANLTPHHIVKRSRGGGNEMTNLTTVCFHHHLEGIHRGLVGVSGRAPDQLVWELGRKVGEAPILAASGDWILGANVSLPTRGGSMSKAVPSAAAGTPIPAAVGY